MLLTIVGNVSWVLSVFVTQYVVFICVFQKKAVSLQRENWCIR